MFTEDYKCIAEIKSLIENLGDLEIIMRTMVEGKRPGRGSFNTFADRMNETIYKEINECNRYVISKKKFIKSLIKTK